MPKINLKEVSEQQFVTALRQRRQEGMSMLYDAYAPVLMGTILRMVPEQEVAEEVLQKVFVTIWTKIHEFDASQNRLLTWGLSIARNICLDIVCSGKASPAPDAAPAELQEPFQVPGNMGPQEKTILELIYLKGYSCHDAASALGITNEALRASLKKAFLQLKAEKRA